MKAMILERLMKVAAAVLEDGGLKDVTAESLLAEDLGLNSITMLMLMIGIEDEFAIRFPAERAGALRTVGDVAAVIEEQLHAAP